MKAELHLNSGDIEVKFIEIGLGNVGGGDKNFLFKQTTASAEWHIQHNLNKYPSVTVIDSAKTQVIGDVIYDDLNNVTLKFTAPFSGSATLN